MNTHSVTKFNPYFGYFALPIIIAANAGIEFCRFARECVFICASMHVTTQLELCFHEQTQIVANAVIEWVAS